jgi:hypothetical protein
MHRKALTGTIDYHTTSIMDLWLIDDSGPFPFPTIDDENYTLQLLDLNSRLPWSFMTKTKSEQTDIIINHIKTMQVFTYPQTIAW